MFPEYDDAALEAAGLVISGDGGKRYDRFRDRIMFPILDCRGRVIGFGGRVLGAGEPKYLNSPETPVFEKGRELYGLYQARNAIRDAGKVVVVEGYMDVVALAQHGVDYAVATLGTATTPVHVQKLFRLTDNVVFCFDGDNAGRKAAWRALENTLPVLADGKNALFLFLPDGEDPDDFVRQHGKAAFERRSRTRCRCPNSCWRSSPPAIRRPPPRAGPHWWLPRGRCSGKSRRRCWRRFSQAARRALRLAGSELRDLLQVGGDPGGTPVGRGRLINDGRPSRTPDFGAGAAPSVVDATVDPGPVVAAGACQVAAVSAAGRAHPRGDDVDRAGRVLRRSRQATLTSAAVLQAFAGRRMRASSPRCSRPRKTSTWTTPPSRPK